MKRIFKKMNIYRRVLLLVLSCGALAFILPTALSLYTLNNVERTLSVQGDVLSESVSEFVWEIAQRRNKEHLTEVAKTRARHIDREFSLNGEDVVILSKMATKIMSSPENYLPRKLPNLRTEANVPYGAPYVYESANLVANGISPELKKEIEIASKITGALEVMSFYYRDYQTSLYIGSKKGYFICVDLFPGKKGEGSVFPTEELRADFLNTFDPRERPWYKLAEQKQTLAFTDTFTGTDGLPDMACVMPYYDKEGFAGVVGIGCTLEDVYQQVEDSAIGDTGFSFALDSHGDIAFSSHREGILSETMEEVDLRKAEDPGLATAAKRMVAGESGVESIVLEGREYYLAFAPMKSIGWSFGTVIEKAEIKTVSYQIKNQVAGEMSSFQEVLRQIFSESLQKNILLLVLLFAISFYAANRAARHITTPINQLSDGVREIAKGNLDKKLTVNTGDEIGELAERFNSMTCELKEYVKNFSEAAAERQRTHTELEIAAKIQAGMLPDAKPLKKGRNEFDLYALMYPAKEVGGDFYDFYFADEENLVITVADVSDKGVPAALFMVTAKTLMKDHVLMYGEEKYLPKTLEKVNDALVKSNPECMFVTAFIGMLHLPTGRFTYVNAGHNPPLLLQKRLTGSSDNMSFDYLPAAKNTVLGFMEGITFKAEQLTLSRGDAVFLYTDGVTEAMNDKKEMFS
ncbi:MAG: SpoIIE family protein phosphatase, partial [Selenomonadaceae bacterium]|nr:SpoIIE family protein phosphatase [Selenomonadaceae bacterium]